MALDPYLDLLGRISTSMGSVVGAAAGCDTAIYILKIASCSSVATVLNSDLGWTGLPMH